MAELWIADARQRVLGPLRAEVLEELIAAGRISGIVHVSKDGKTWGRVEEHPEIAAAQEVHAGDARKVRHLKEAARLREELARLLALAPHEVFQLPPNAPLPHWRASFFRLVKRFYPERPELQEVPELQQLNAAIFEFLSRLMAFIERHPPGVATAPAGPPPTLQRTGPQPALRDTGPRPALQNTGPQPAVQPVEPAPRDSALRSSAGEDLSFDDIDGDAPTAELELATESPCYSVREFVGLEVRSGNQVQLTVRVTPETCWIFTDDPIFNLIRCAAFIPYDRALDLGTRVKLLFRFDAPERVVVAQGNVSSWSAGKGKQPRGFGVQFLNPEKADLAFLRDFVARFGLTANRSGSLWSGRTT